MSPALVGNSPFGVVGGGMNFGRMFGVDAEYMFYDLTFRPGVIQSQNLHGQSGHMQSVSLDGVVNVPRHLFKFWRIRNFRLRLLRSNRFGAQPSAHIRHNLSARVEMVGSDLE